MQQEQRNQQSDRGDLKSRFLLIPKLGALGEPFGKASIVDLSARGARLEHSTPVREQSAVNLEIHLPNEAEPLLIAGHVIWTRLAWRGRGSQPSCWISGIELDKASGSSDGAVGYLQRIGRAVPLESVRKTIRYQLTPPISSNSRSGGECRLLDASETGLRIDSSRPLRPGIEETLVFQMPLEGLQRRISVTGRVVWSKALPPGELPIGRMLYMAGIRVRTSSDAMKNIMERLCEEGFARIDVDSAHRRIEKTRRQAAERKQQTSAKPKGPEVSDSDLLLIRHIRERLSDYPDDAVQWYNRAKFAAADPHVARMIDPDTPYRTDILAVWECLEHTISLATIAAAFRRL